MRNGIGHGHNTTEEKAALGVALQNAPPIRPVAPRVLHIVVACGVRLPDVDGNPLDRVAVDVLHRADSEQLFAALVVRHDVAVLEDLRIMRVERAEDGPLGGARRLGVVDAVDQQAEAKDVRQEDEFLADIGADLARGRQEIDGLEPLTLREAGLAGVVVEVVGQAVEEEAQARGGVARAVDEVDVLGDVVDCEVFEGGDVDFGGVHGGGCGVGCGGGQGGSGV